MRLILASTSPYRKALLARAGVSVECVAPNYVELPIDGLSPREQIVEHGKNKALSVAASLNGAADTLVIGSDQGLVFGDTLVGKPGTVERAVAQLMSFAGKRCQLVTSLCLVRVLDRRIWLHVDVTGLDFAPLTEDEIRAYIAYDMPLDCAGSFKIESRGPMLFDAIRTEDPTAIEGLPVMALHRMLREIQRDAASVS